MLKIILLVLFVFAFFISSRGRPEIKPPSACERHRRFPEITGHPMKVRCDKSGNYKRKQCRVGKPKMCACYHHEGQTTHFSSTIKSCRCFVERYKFQKKGISECGKVPVCNADGHYRERTCCPKPESGIPPILDCWCHDTSTGEKLANGSYGLYCCQGAASCHKIGGTKKPRSRISDHI